VHENIKQFFRFFKNICILVKHNYGETQTAHELPSSLMQTQWCLAAAATPIF